MKLNTRSRYAVMALVDLASSEGQGCSELTSLKTMAARQDLSVTYLEQLFAKLRRKGLVRSMRGVNGGYALAKPAAEISIGHVVDALDDAVKMTRCKGNGTKGTGCLPHGALCKTHHLWATLEQHIKKQLDTMTLASCLETDVHTSATRDSA